MEINPTTLVLLTSGMTLLGTLLGVLITSLFNIRATRLAKESEERRQTRQLIVTAAIENWKQVGDLMIRTGAKGAITPLEVFLVHMAKAADRYFRSHDHREQFRGTNASG